MELTSIRHFYDFPELYELLLTPTAELVEAVGMWIQEYSNARAKFIMDPACGTAFWLRELRPDRGYGCDINPHMIDWAKGRIPPGIQLQVSDMRSVSTRSDAGFDLAINLEGSVGHLGSLGELREHLNSVSQCLRVGGLYFLGVRLASEGPVDTAELTLLTAENVEIETGGVALLDVVSIKRDPRKRLESIVYDLRTIGSRLYPHMLREEFNLRTFCTGELRYVWRDARFALLASYSMEIPQFPKVPLVNNIGDVVLILQKV